MRADCPLSSSIYGVVITTESCESRMKCYICLILYLRLGLASIRPGLSHRTHSTRTRTQRQERDKEEWSVSLAKDLLKTVDCTHTLCTWVMLASNQLPVLSVTSSDLTSGERRTARAVDRLKTIVDINYWYLHKKLTSYPRHQ